MAAAVAVALGAGYGIAVVSWTQETTAHGRARRLGRTDRHLLPLAYAGFLPPTVLVTLSARLPDSVMLAAVAVAVVALVCLVLVTVGGRGDRGTAAEFSDLART
ncbi:hypothetical protein ACFWN5_35390 [Streptomyces sp. NPDC058430]|uniref:hypothetical protein n=1 Tax=Streptomyces sp. NPDC058430 TaxID=3346495 RepID=UPI00365FD076